MPPVRLRSTYSGRNERRPIGGWPPIAGSDRTLAGRAGLDRLHLQSYRRVARLSDDYPAVLSGRLPRILMIARLLYFAALASGGLAVAQTSEETFAELRRAMGRGEYDNALRLGERIARRDPYFDRAWDLLVTALERKGALSGARDYLGTIGQPQVCYALTIFATKEKRWGEADSLARACVQRFPGWLPPYRAWADNAVESDSVKAFVAELEPMAANSAGHALAAGLALTLSGSLDRARPHLENARALRGDDFEVDEALYYHYSQSKLFAPAEQTLLRILARAKVRNDADWIVRANGRLGQIELDSRRIEQARQRLEETLPLTRDFGLRQGEHFQRRLLGAAYLELGLYGEAMAQFEAAAPLAGSAIDRARTAARMGQVLRWTGDYHRSARQYEAAAALAREAKNRTEEAMYTTNLALAYFDLGDSARSASSLRAARALPVALPFHRAQILFDQADLERKLGRPREAAALYGESVSLAAETTKDRATESRARLLRAGLAIEQRRLADAEADLDTAAYLAGELGLARERCQALLVRGRLALERGSDDASLTHYAAGLREAETMRTAPLQVQAHLGLSDVHWKMRRLTEALSHRQAALALLERMRAGLANPLQAAEFLARRQETYRETMEIQLAMGRVPGAFATAERARARALLDMFAAEPAQRVEERRLTAAVASAQDAFQSQRGSAARLRDAQAELERYLDSAEETWSANDRPADAESTKHAMRTTGSILLHYTLGRRRSSLFLVSARGVRHVWLPAAAVIESQVAELRLRIDRRPGVLEKQAFQAVAQRLSKTIWDAASLGLRDGVSVTIVPDGALRGVPFEVLLTPGGRHLVEQFRIRYAPSASTLLASQERGQQKAPNALLAFADPAPVAFASNGRRAGESGVLGGLPY
ncbi:MAG: CHAT domain-containing protein, partial [Acidobacteria bacterium]|nr:CHAT domain-containing protein [Acidobacteriota bacterium]